MLDQADFNYKKKKAALHSYEEFINLIGFRGGMGNFKECHRDLIRFISRTGPEYAEKPWVVGETPEVMPFTHSVGNRRKIILMPRGHLKAQALTTPILTPNGFVPLGELQEGSAVIGSDGAPTQITHLHPESLMDLYRVTTSDGRTTLCNKEHLWEVSTSDWRGKTKVVSTEQLLRNYKRQRVDFRTGRKFLENHYKVRTVEVQHVERSYLIPPYTLGVWLGDGTSGASTFTCHDDDTEIMHHIGAYKNNTKYRWTVPKLCVPLKELGVLNNKHIPSEYMLGSVEQRYELLRGLLDTDGTCHHTHGQTSFCNTNERLVDGVVTLVRSIGGVASKTPLSHCNGWNVTIWVSKCPFKLTRKANKWKPNNKGYVFIKDIQLEAQELGRCITVANQDGLYVTQDYLLTHNSTVSSVGYVLWRIYQDPNIRIVVGTGVLDLSRAFMREVRTYLEDPDLIKYVWNSRPHIQGTLIPTMAVTTGGQRKSKAQNPDDESDSQDKKIVWNNEMIQVIRSKRMKEPTIMAWSVGTIRTGFHCDLVIFDDIVTFDNVKSPQLIETTHEWIRDIKSILDPYNPDSGLGGETIVLGTRYAEPDYYGFILDGLDTVEYDIHFRNLYKNGRDNSDGFLWPERYNEQGEKELVKELGMKRFTSQYLNRILNESDCTMHPDKVVPLEPHQVIKVVPGMVHIKKTPEGPTIYVRPLIVIDPAFSQKEGADNTSITVGGIDKDRNMYVLDNLYGKYTIKGIIDATYKLCDQWFIKVVWVEANGTQVGLLNSFKDYFSTYYPITLRPFNPKGMGEKKAAISAAVEPYVTDNRLYVKRSVITTQKIRNEFLYFPAETVHDDFLDTLKMLAHCASPTGAPQRVKSRREQPSWRQVNAKFGGTR